jgi:23S rRNA-intervening sequence protein
VVRQFDVTRWQDSWYNRRMQSFQDLDAFKVCHDLTIRMHDVAKKVGESDPELGAQLWFSALVASSRIARGSGFHNRRMFSVALDRTLGALCEISYDMNMAHTMGLVSDEIQREIEGLRGRAVFYTTKLLLSLQGDPDADS